MSASLVRVEPQWSYLGPQKAGSRHLAVWRIGVRHVVAIVTERADSGGISVTNAAEEVAEQLAVEYPGELVELIEFWPDDPNVWTDGIPVEHFDSVVISRGVTRWDPVPAEDLEQRLGADFRAAWNAKD